jgi:hypothetical protein
MFNMIWHDVCISDENVGQNRSESNVTGDIRFDSLEGVRTAT